MPKYNICVSDYTHYISKEIEAQDKDEASNIYMSMVASGDVEVANSDYCEVEVEEIKV